MVTRLFDGSSLLLQDDLLHQPTDDPMPDLGTEDFPLDHLAASVYQAFAALDNEGALLVIEVDKLVTLQPDRQSELLEHVIEIARASIRRTDILAKIGPCTICIALPGSGRVGMTRVADAIRERVAAAVMDNGELLSTTVTIGAVHTSESKLVDPDDLLLAARVHLDAARAAGGNRTNWSDWSR